MASLVLVPFRKSPCLKCPEMFSCSNLMFEVLSEKYIFRAVSRFRSIPSEKGHVKSKLLHICRSLFSQVRSDSVNILV